MLHKRKNLLSIIIILTLVIFSLVLTCCDSEQENFTEQRFKSDSFSIHFIDVGEGDAIFVQFDDGKTMLVDCGERDDDIAEKIKNFLLEGEVTTIDFFVLTHPDSDHIGNAEFILENFKVNKLFVSDILPSNLTVFPMFSSLLDKAEQMEIEINVSDCYDVIKGENYFVAFLTPYPSAFRDSVYVDINSTKTPTATQVNALSPIMFVQSFGKRFILTGDAPASVERTALKQLDVGKIYYDGLGITIDLESVDFLKVGHHGANDSSCMDFLSVLKPKNVVISVAGDNFYGHPSSEVLERLLEANINQKIYRTDVDGSISVLANKSGQIKVLTDANFD